MVAEAGGLYPARVGKRAMTYLTTLLLVASAVLFVGHLIDGDALRSAVWLAVALFWGALATRGWRGVRRAE